MGNIQSRRLYFSSRIVIERYVLDEVFKFLGREGQSSEAVPFLAWRNLIIRPEDIQLGGGEKPGWIVFGACQRQAESLHRITNEHDRLIVGSVFKSLQGAGQIMASQICHQLGEFVVAS